MNHRSICVLALVTLLAGCTSDPLLYENEAFSIRASRVTEGPYEAIAVSPTEIRSSYEAAFREGIRGPIVFKFALNGQDNERAPMADHRLAISTADSLVVAPVISFGDPHPSDTTSVVAHVARPFTVRFRVDLSPVFRAFADRGYFESWDGKRLRRSDFDGVYVAGSAPHLTWDFSTLSGRSDLRMQDPDGDGVYELEVAFNTSGPRALEGGEGVWRQTLNSSAYPEYLAPEPLLVSLYNLSIEELQQSIRPDGAFMAGAEWPGIWTRDVSYAAVLSLAFLAPEATRLSLLAKTARGRIVQDTGTGGAWPVSSDRMTWALAAWELYAATGDRVWLREAFDIIRQSAADDRLVVRDPETGLYRGESSFLDWREQTYPRWMDPRDIFESLNLGTNVVHAASQQVLARMATALGEDSGPFAQEAEHLVNAINHWMWVPERGFYAQYRYGRVEPALSPRSETLGEALAILYGVARDDRRSMVASRTPTSTYGPPSIHPQIPGIPPYHNDSVWPFVAGYWTWAGADVGNAAVVEHGLASIYRSAALFLTNKENMVASTGRFDGTEINSDRQLWSVASNLATVYRVLFGLRFDAEALRFQPFVPESYRGTRVLRGLRYRDAVLHVELSGFGRRVARFELDGVRQEGTSVPGDLTGTHTVTIALDNNLPGGAARLVAVAQSPDTPHSVLDADTLRWGRVAGAVAYVVSPGDVLTSDTLMSVGAFERPVELQVRAVSAAGLGSFRSEPIRISAPDFPVIVQPGPAGRAGNGEGFTGPGFVRLTQAGRSGVSFKVQIPQTGTYRLFVRYANGEGPLNTDNRAAVRTVLVDGERTGVMVMPQRGRDRWTDWGFSSVVTATLDAGPHAVELVFTPDNVNMSATVNTAWIDALYVDLR